jgi:hypothetical protein
VTEATVLLVDVGHGGTTASLLAFDAASRSVAVLDVACPPRPGAFQRRSSFAS